MAAKKTKTKKSEQSPGARKFHSLPAADPYEMTDQEILLQIARDNLATYGTTIAPVGAQPPAAPKISRMRRIDPPPPPEEEEKRLFAAPRRAKAVDAKWFAIEKKCPHCNLVKNVMPDFGVVNRRGVEQPAGWCKECRSKTDYRKRDRVYRK